MKHASNDLSASAECGTPASARTGNRGVIHQAAELLQARHHIREISAYELLITAAVESHRNVRDTAYSILEESGREPSLL
ncbi:MAG: hypothetical protein JWR90_194 [Marmoricola sp.]|jgi:AmiR/NasT family two-component response regulator|nr:hypothetical protein [Marmoricola sp.]